MKAADYIGLTDIADMASVSRQRAHQLAARPDFPAPAIELRHGRLWMKRDVEAWMKKAGRAR